MQYDLEWDPKKAHANIGKHGTSFEDGATIFNAPNALTLFDTEHNDNEDRWITLGISKSGSFLVVCHTFHEVDKESCVIRIFSCRKATKNEIKQYGE